MSHDGPHDYKVSRRVGYAAVLKAAPAYTFGEKHGRSTNDGPGPGEYDPISLYAEQKTAVFGSSTRTTSNQPATPSGYKPSSFDLKTAPQFTFGGKRVDHTASETPGPGAYDPGPGKPGQPPITIGARTHSSWHKDGPAPNAYNPEYRVKERPGVSLKFKHDRALDHFSSDPGPGEYPMELGPSSPGKSFGSSRPGMRPDNGVPGPVYNPDKASISQRASYSFARSARDPRLDNGVPGPGRYGNHAPIIDRPSGFGVKSDNRSAPAFSIPCRGTSVRPDVIPGPQDYRPTDVMRKSAPVFSLHGKLEQGLTLRVPGPGAYQPDASYKALRPAPPAISIGLRKEEFKSRESQPGPGAYSHDGYMVSTACAPTLKFRHEPQFTLQSTPAPHDYADPSFIGIYSPGKKGKGISFGIRHKVFDCADVPGPIYKVGCSTLGVTAVPQVFKSKLNLTVVL